MNRKGTIIWTLAGAVALVILLLVTTGAWAEPNNTSAAAPLAPADVFSSTISYQGRLLDTGGDPVDGSPMMTFRLYAQAEGGAHMWEDAFNVPVENGLFNAALEVPPSLFDGQALWLGVHVEGDAQEMTPRQQLLPTSYAFYALAAPWSGLTDVPPDLADGDDDTLYSDGVGLSLAGTTFEISTTYRLPQACGDGDIAEWNTSASAWDCGSDDIGGGAAAWLLGGNAGTSPGTDILGTTDAASLTLVVNAVPALRLEPATVPNLIGGYRGNSVTSGVQGTTIGGGGASGYPNMVTADYATIGGGYGNVVTGTYATVGGGEFNTASDESATVGGGYDNVASGWGTTIGGGGFSFAFGPHATVGGGWQNTASGEGATVGGGTGNHASSEDATVAGGEYNIASGLAATIPGGSFNTASGANATIGGGSSNVASGWTATVGGGLSNTASSYRATISGGAENTASGNRATISGGEYNTASGTYTTIGGGSSNTTSGSMSTISGGYQNTASGDMSTVSGGLGNTASYTYTTVSGGYQNTASRDYASVGGGQHNQATAEYATIAGGGPSYPASSPTTTNNRVYDDYGTIGGGGNNQAGNDDGDSTDDTYTTVGGGEGNTASRDYATVGGGYFNTADGYVATIGGGWDNTASGDHTTVGGGALNSASGYGATIPGGVANTAQGQYSFATGRRAKANADGCFAWGDSTDADFNCNNPNRFMVRATGGVHLYTNSSLNSGLYLSAGGSAWNTYSDRQRKENFEPVDTQELLAHLAEIPITSWNYKAQDPSIRHIGPMAQDFNALLPDLGGEGEKYINTLDADGVALAAIQGLYAQNQALAAENAALQAQVDDLEVRLTALEQTQTTHLTRPSITWWPLVGLVVLAGGSMTWRRREIKR